MDGHPVDPAQEIRDLQRCMNDLVSILALPAAWSRDEPGQILDPLLDALLRMVDLTFVYGRVRDAESAAPIEVLRIAESSGMEQHRQEIHELIRAQLGDGPELWPPQLQHRLGDEKISIVSLPLGLQHEFGIIIGGSGRPDFPRRTEQLILKMAANQAATGLQQARLLKEQKLLVSKLDERVAERTAGLAVVNEELKREIGERKRAEDERKSSEARHRLVIEAASDAVISIDENDTIILANPATKRIFGYDPAELVGQPLTVLMPESMRRRHETGYARYLETGKRHLEWQGTEVTALRANGEVFPVEVSFGEMSSNGHRIFTGFIRDLTEKKHAEEALAKARSELAHMTRITSLGALTASIAHEINQPLSGITTNANTCLRMLSGNPPNIEGARETARRALRDVDRTSAVIARLRALFNQTGGALESVDLNEAAREVVALSLSDLRRNQVSLQQELAEDLPSVKGDRVQLQQVILNLLRNGSDSMNGIEDRPRTLVIRTEREEGDRVRLAVRDAGIGFDPGQANRIFEAFYSTKDGGMGIGLSISRSIIEAHYGRLWAALNDGPGSTFTFSVPCDGGPAVDPT
jgi:PAS domain S-box-containing protein